MIAKSLLIISVLSSLLRLSPIEDKFDDALLRYNYYDEKDAHAFMDLGLASIHRNPRIKNNTYMPSNIYAQNYLLGDLESGKIILSKNSKDRVPIASTTKIMTFLVAIDLYQLDEIVTISKNAESQPGADSFLIVGEKISVLELMHCMLIKSGNDSAYALAEHLNNNNDDDSATEGGVNAFIDKMNQKAIKLGLKNTKFADPAGLDTSGYSNAYELFLMTKYAMRYDVFRSIVKKDRYVAKDISNSIYHELNNSNRLVSEYKYSGAVGVKTGYMPEAGHCLVSAASRNNHTLIGVILHTNYDTASASADESRKLLDWGFNSIEW